MLMTLNVVNDNVNGDANDNVMQRVYRNLMQSNITIAI